MGLTPTRINVPGEPPGIGNDRPDSNSIQRIFSFDPLIFIRVNKDAEVARKLHSICVNDQCMGVIYEFMLLKGGKQKAKNCIG